MGQVPTDKLERELRKLYLQWLAGFPSHPNTEAYLAEFEAASRALIARLGGQAASLGAIAGFPVPKTLELSPVADLVYNQMNQAAISAGITAGLNATDVARQIINSGLDQGFNRLNRLARTETVRAYWGNQWNSVEGLDLVLVWSAEDNACEECLAVDGMIVDDPDIQDHPNGRCTLVPKRPERVPADTPVVQPDWQNRAKDEDP